MKYTFQLLCSLLLVITQGSTIHAQGTELFEGATPGATSFTNNGKTFNLTTNAPAFFVANIAGLGYGPSNRFIHLADSYGSISSILVPAGTFKMNSFWFYVSGNAEVDPGTPNPNTGPGSVTFRGKLNGNTLFSFTKTTGFATTLATPGNGFALINFATEGGANNTNTFIDQLEIQLSSNFDYFAIDNFNWAQGALPATFGTINAVASGKSCQVSWQTLSETNNDHFEIQASTDGQSFKTIASVASKAVNGHSDTLIDYSLSIDIGGRVGLAGLGVLSLLGIAVANKKRYSLMICCSLFAAVIFWTGCSKQESVTPDSEKTIYLRVVQIDKDGSRSVSKAVTVTRK